jgi:transcriptional regulator with XRE-family HTH domain
MSQCWPYLTKLFPGNRNPCGSMRLCSKDVNKDGALYAQGPIGRHFNRTSDHHRNAVTLLVMKHGALIKTYRKQAGITQQELADTLGLTQTYIALIEGDKRIPAVDTFLKICELVNIPEEMYRGAVPYRNEVKTLLDKLGADEMINRVVDLLGEERIRTILEERGK